MDITNTAGGRELSDSVYQVVFTPVLEREEYQREPLRTKLLLLQEKMGEDEFETYINSLLAVKYNGRDLWLITRSERNRTLIEGKYRPLILEVFEVKSLRVISET